jgi:hypothetical protein
MNTEIRYLDINHVDLSRILIKESTILYQYPDGIIKKLYIKTPYLTIKPNNKFNKIRIDITNDKYFYENLIKKINELRKINEFRKIDEKNVDCLIFDGHWKKEVKDKMLMTLYFNKNKTEIIKHNISSKYQKMEIIKENIEEVIEKINLSKKYKMEGMFIFTPIIYMNKNMLITYKAEIKYENQNIKSYLQNNEIDINYVDKFKKIVVEL